VAPSRVTLAGYFDEWLKGQRTQLKAATWATYRGKLDTYVLPKLGSVRLQALTAAMLTTLYAELYQSGGRGGRPLALSTVRYCHRVLYKALNDAVRTGDLLAINVATRATLPKHRPDNEDEDEIAAELNVWNSEQVRAFAEHTAEHRLAAVFAVTVNNGLRRGETLGLRWRDVDLDHGRLHIRHTLGVINNELSFSTPKTKKSKRSFRIDPVTIEALRAHRKRQRAERLAYPGQWSNDRDLVFTMQDGSPIHPNDVTYEFRRLSVEADLPRIRFHDLRHTYATLALQAGVNIKTVSQRLGHASVQITWDTYSHVLPDDDEQAAQLFHAHVYGRRSGQVSS
jgi:integrase